jgi:anti-repressor protein
MRRGDGAAGMSGLALTVCTMGSREIAELVGKEHSHVCRDIVEQLGKLEGGVARFGDTYHNAQNGQDYPCYALPYRETMILVSGYRVDLRAKIIDRWMELERAEEPAYTIPKTYGEALQLAANQAIELEVQSAALALAAPKCESFDALMRSERQMSITEAAKNFGLHPKTKVFPYLRARGYLTLTGLPTQAAIDAGYLSLKETTDQAGNVWPQAVVEAWQLERWRAHVVRQVKHFADEGAPA